jgi:hypothetical protein
VKYNIDERWMRALIEVDLNDTSARKIGEAIFYESLHFRMGDGADAQFENILAETKFRS